MNLVLSIPDEIAESLGAEGLERRALEAFAAQEYRAGRLESDELRRLLGFETRFEVDAFLKARGVEGDYSIADFEREMRDMDRLGV